MSLLRIVLCFALALTASAFAPASALASSKVASRASVTEMAAKKKRAGKATTEGKGGILPWVTNAPGTYAKPLMLSSVDFLGEDGDKWIGWGFMPSSVKKLYNRGGRKGLL